MRVQIVEEDTNKLFYELLREFERKAVRLGAAQYVLQHQRRTDRVHAERRNPDLLFDRPGCAHIGAVCAQQEPVVNADISDWMGTERMDLSPAAELYETRNPQQTYGAPSG